MDATAMRKRIADAMVARLATVGAGGKPHVVPISFAVDGETIYFAVDAKPKRTTDLQRLRNIAANPSVSVLVDHYEDDWTRLWWVRVDRPAPSNRNPKTRTWFASRSPEVSPLPLMFSPLGLTRSTSSAGSPLPPFGTMRHSSSPDTPVTSMSTSIVAGV